jgi:hypothetical protein
MLATAAAIAPPPPPRSGEERRGERARVGGEAATEQLFEIASTRNGERAKRNGTRTHTARPRRSCLWTLPRGPVTTRHVTAGLQARMRSTCLGESFSNSLEGSVGGRSQEVSGDATGEKMFRNGVAGPATFTGSRLPRRASRHVTPCRQVGPPDGDHPWLLWARSMAFVRLAGGTELCGHTFGSTAPMLAFMDVGRVVKR